MIRPNRYGPVRTRHVAVPIQIRFSNQICAKSLEIHNFCSVTQNLTNNIPLETLEHVESNSALIIRSFSIQFETIFKLNQTYL
jgi:hypothetical protein